MDHLCYFCLVLLCFRARLFVDALWSPAGKELTSWLSFVMSSCLIVTLPLSNWYLGSGVVLSSVQIFSVFVYPVSTAIKYVQLSSLLSFSVCSAIQCAQLISVFS